MEKKQRKKKNRKNVKMIFFKQKKYQREKRSTMKNMDLTSANVADDSG